MRVFMQQIIMTSVNNAEVIILDGNDVMLFDDRPYLANPLSDETEDGHTKTIVYTIEDTDVDCPIDLCDDDNLKLVIEPEVENSTEPQDMSITEVSSMSPEGESTSPVDDLSNADHISIPSDEIGPEPMIEDDLKPVAADLDTEPDYTTTDPAMLLKALSPMLGNNGNIKDVEQVATMTKLMKDAEKLVTKCVYSNILRATTENILNAFVAEGGWDILNDWLQEARKDVNDGFLRELLKVYGQIPITVSLLKHNSCAKTLKQISKSDNPVLKKMSAEIVDRWMTTVRQASGTSSSSSEKSKKKKHHHKDKDSKDNDIKSGESRRSSNSSPEHKARSSPERDATPFINGATTIKTEPSKPRAKTVKAVPTKFRSTGLEQETVLPQVRKKDTKDLKSLAVKRTSLTTLKSLPPEKKARPALPSPLPSTSTTLEKKGGIKLIAARPKPVQVYESAGFMDALTTTTQTAASLRRKRRGSNSKLPTSPPGTKQPSVPSFYQDTMEDDRAASPDNEVKDDGDKSQQSDGSPDQTTEGIVPKKKKKRVSFAAEAELTRFFYFEMDDTERVNVNKVKDFASSIKQEMEMERQLHENAKRRESTSGINWRRPRPISGLHQTIIRGCNSTEKELQKQREQGVLQALFFSKSMIPDSPVEPEPEAYEPVDPKNIPLEDETGTSASETVFTDYPKPVDMHDISIKAAANMRASSNAPASAGLTLHPDLANFVASMAQGQLQGGDENQTNQYYDVASNQQSIHNGSYVAQMPPYSQGMAPPQNQPPPSMAPPNYYGPPHSGIPPTGPPTGPPPNGMPPPHGMPPPPHNLPPPGYNHQHGPPPRYDVPPPHMNGMRPHDEEWGENMHGGPMMGPRGSPRGPHMPYRRGDHRGPPRGPPRGRSGRGGLPPVVCRNFMKGTCRYEKACSYLHPGVTGPPL